MPQIALAVKGIASLITGVIAPTSLGVYKATTFAIYSALSVGVTYATNAIQRALIDEKKGLDQRRDYRQTIFSPIENVRVILGRAKVAGHVCYSGTLGRESRLGLILGFGPYEAIEKVWLAGEEILIRVDPNNASRLIPQDIPANAKWFEIVNNVKTPLLEIYPYLLADGSQGREMDSMGPTQAQANEYDYGGIVDYDDMGRPIDENGNIVDDLNIAGDPDNSDSKISVFPEWDNTYQLNGFSWVYIRMKQSQYGKDNTKPLYEPFPDIRWQFLVKGLKHSVPDIDGNLQPAEWHENAASNRYWIETNIFGLDPDRFDFGAFIAAQNLCNEVVTIDDANIPAALQGEYTQSRIRYHINGVVEFGENARQLRDQLDLAWSGELIDAKGKYIMRPGVERMPSMHINADELKIESEIIPSPNLTNRINSIIGVLEQSEDDDYNQLPLAKFTDMQAQTRDMGERPYELHYRFINNAYTCGRLQANSMRLSRGNLQYSLTIKPDDGFQIYQRIPTDIITVTDSEYAFVRKKFFIKEIAIIDWVVSLGLQEYIDGTYTDTLHTPNLHSRDIRFTDRTFVPRLSGLTLTESLEFQSDGSEVTVLVVSWDTKDVAFTEVRARVTGTQDWLTKIVSLDSAPYTSLLGGKEYEVQARHVNQFGYSGGWVKGSIQLSGDDRQPAATPATFNVGNTLSRTYKDSVDNVGRNDFTIKTFGSRTYLYIGWGTDFRYLRHVPFNTFFRFVLDVNGVETNFPYLILGGHRAFENYLRIAVSLRANTAPALVNDTEYDIQLQHVQAPELTIEIGEGVDNVNETGTLSRVYENSQQESRFGNNDFTFNRIVGQFDYFNIAEGNSDDMTLLDMVETGQILYMDVEVVNTDGTTTVTELHWRIREIRMLQVNSIDSITFIADPLETNAFILDPQAIYTIKFGTETETDPIDPIDPIDPPPVIVETERLFVLNEGTGGDSGIPQLWEITDIDNPGNTTTNDRGDITPAIGDQPLNFLHITIDDNTRLWLSREDSLWQLSSLGVFDPMNTLVKTFDFPEATISTYNGDPTTNAPSGNFNLGSLIIRAASNNMNAVVINVTNDTDSGKIYYYDGNDWVYTNYSIFQNYLANWYLTISNSNVIIESRLLANTDLQGDVRSRQRGVNYTTGEIFTTRRQDENDPDSDIIVVSLGFIRAQLNAQYQLDDTPGTGLVFHDGNMYRVQGNQLIRINLSANPVTETTIGTVDQDITEITSDGTNMYAIKKTAINESSLLRISLNPLIVTDLGEFTSAIEVGRGIAWHDRRLIVIDGLHRELWEITSLVKNAEGVLPSTKLGDIRTGLTNPQGMCYFPNQVQDNP